MKTRPLSLLNVDFEKTQLQQGLKMSIEYSCTTYSKPIVDYGGRLFLADQVDCNFKQLDACRHQIEKIERIWSGLEF